MDGCSLGRQRAIHSRPHSQQQHRVSILGLTHRSSRWLLTHMPPSLPPLLLTRCNSKNILMGLSLVWFCFRDHSLKCCLLFEIFHSRSHQLHLMDLWSGLVVNRTDLKFGGILTFSFVVLAFVSCLTSKSISWDWKSDTDGRTNKALLGVWLTQTNEIEGHKWRYHLERHHHDCPVHCVRDVFPVHMFP